MHALELELVLVSASDDEAFDFDSGDVSEVGLDVCLWVGVRLEWLLALEGIWVLVDRFRGGMVGWGEFLPLGVGIDRWLDRIVVSSRCRQ